MDNRRGFWTGACALVALSAFVYQALLRNALAASGGHLVLVIDDAYIHLSIAKNLALHGVWGVTPYANSSASSSPLWILVLALGGRLFGFGPILPFALNLICVLAIVVYLFYRFQRSGILPSWAFLATVWVFAAGPLHTMPFTGMEHSLHILLVVMFGFWFMDALSPPRQDGPWQAGLDRRLVIYGGAICAAMVLCRFESVFLLPIPILVALFTRRFRLALCIFLSSCAAIGAFAVFSLLEGMPIVPNSVILKGSLPKPGVTFLQLIGFRANVYLHHLDLTSLALVTIALAVALSTRKFNRSVSGLRAWSASLIFATACQVTLAAVGWFYRYEAYLIVAMITVCVLGINEIIQHQSEPKGIVKTVSNVLAAGAILLGIQYRTLHGFLDVPSGCADVYLQKIQAARFIHEFGDHGRFAVNDIGAVSFYTNVHLLDLWGLASNDVRDLKLAGKFETPEIGKLLAEFRPDAIIVYPFLFQGVTALPPPYTPVAVWVIPQPAMTSQVMVFYAASGKMAENLKFNLKKFEPELPQEVAVRYLR